MPPRPVKKIIPSHVSFAIIGAGLGGLALACRLASRGKNVHVFEKNPFPGGRLSSFTKKGYTIDRGPTFVLMPGEFEELFSYCGRRMENYFQFENLHPYLRIHYWDGTSLDMSSRLPHAKKEFERVSSGSWQGVLDFLAYEQQKYDTIYPAFIDRNHSTVKALVLSGEWGKMLGADGFTSMWEHAGSFFPDEKIRLAFSFQSMYVGESPLRTPGTYSMIPFIEMMEGVWYPSGGMPTIMRGIETLARELGVVIHYSCPVERIMVEEKGARGIVLKNGKTITTDTLISNLDLPATYARLIPRENRTTYYPDKKIDSLTYGCSAFMLHLGVKKDYPQLLHHNVFFSPDFLMNFREIFDEKILPTQPSFYVNVPTRTHPKTAPRGKHLLNVLVPVPHLKKDGGVDWKSEKEVFTQRVLERLEASGLTDLRKNIEMIEIFTPDDWEKLGGMHFGSTFGLAPLFLQSSVFRPSQKSEEVENLYFVGASTHPGSGMPMVLISARTCERLLQETEGH
ncbi:MAG: phytoene desaturase family protein [Candidatus Diapherotrites archaeon]|nr:phytoene desaturase family protein [Candidatus Diapherotrites archaeon]MDZ4256720.1 phytoene desaturase family protein [archaeon]